MRQGLLRNLRPLSDHSSLVEGGRGRQGEGDGLAVLKEGNVMTVERNVCSFYYDI
jgi:hypothetical protein